MNPEIRARWLTALRGGTYQQGKECLRTLNDEFCCLGVLRDVMGKQWQRGSINYTTPSWHSAYLPPDESAEAVLDSGTQSVLGNKNDGGWTFPQIADWIEENL